MLKEGVLYWITQSSPGSLIMAVFTLESLKAWLLLNP